MNKTAKNNNSLYVQPTHLHSTVTPIHLIIHKLDAVLHLLRRKEFGLANHGWKSHEMMQLNFPIRTIALWWSTAHKWKHKIIGVFLTVLTIHSTAGCRSTHSPVLDLVNRLCGSLTFLLHLGGSRPRGLSCWLRGCPRLRSIIPGFHQHDGLFWDSGSTDM